MNDRVRPQDEDGASPDEPPADAEPARPWTVYELRLAHDARHVVLRRASWMAKRFPRLVRKDGVMTVEDFIAIGEEALLRAARDFRDDFNHDFVTFARCRVRFAMAEALDGLLFQERVKRAATQSEDNYCAFFRDSDYDVMKHDEAEARRRYRAFANGVLAATFAATVEEAGQCLDTAELDARREYEHALAILRAALARLLEADREMLALMYRDRMNLKDASEALGIRYGTARARHARALKLLHEQLVEQGITRAPRPLVLPDAGGLLDSRAPPTNDTGAGDSG